MFAFSMLGFSLAWPNLGSLSLFSSTTETATGNKNKAVGNQPTTTKKKTGERVWVFACVEIAPSTWSFLDAFFSLKTLCLIRDYSGVRAAVVNGRKN